MTYERLAYEFQARTKMASAEIVPFGGTEFALVHGGMSPVIMNLVWTRTISKIIMSKETRMCVC